MVLHVALAGGLAFFLFRRWECSAPAALLGATVFELGAYFASQAQHLGAVCGAAWLPLAWLAATQLTKEPRARWAAALAAAWAMSVLAGFTAVTLVVGISTVGVFCLGRPAWRAWAWLSLAAGMVFLLTAPALLPAMALTDWSVASLRPQWNRGAGVPAIAWLSFVWPNALGVFEEGIAGRPGGIYNFTMLYRYSGVVAPLACLWALRGGKARTLLGLGAAFAVLESGSRLPGFAAVFAWLPASVRGAFYADYFLAASTLAVAGVVALIGSRLPWRLAWVLALLTAGELTLISANRPINSAPLSWRRVSSEGTIDGWSEIPRAIHGQIDGRQPAGRVDALDKIAALTAGASQRRIATPNGDNPFAPLAVLQVRQQFAAGPWWERQWPVSQPGSPWLDYLNVEVLAATTAKEDVASLLAQGWRRLGDDSLFRLYARHATTERFFFPSHIVPVRDQREALERLGAIDPRETAVVEGTGTLEAGRGQVTVVRFAPDQIELAVSVERAGVLVSSESHHPGWRVWIDGQAAPILRVNGAFRGVAVPAGEHRIEFRYVAEGLVWLVVLMGVSWLGLVVMGAATGIRRH